MNNEPDFLIEGIHDQLGDALLDVLQEQNIIEESKKNLIKNKLLLEKVRFQEDSQEILTESSNKNTPDMVYYGERPISYSHFKSIWLNWDTFRTEEAVATAIGLPPETWSSTSNMSKYIRTRLPMYFKNAGNRDVDRLPQFGKRKEWYQMHVLGKNGNDSEWGYDINMDNVYRGRRGERKPSSPTLEQINKSSVVPGEFYNDVSRIKPRNYSNWIRAFRAIKKKIKDVTDRLSGRRWEHVFIMGYAMERNLLVEIWYNAATGKFYIYDQNGVELTRPAITLQESLRGMVNYIIRVADTDSDAKVLMGASKLAKEFSASYMQGLNTALGKDVGAIERANSLLSKEARDEAKKQSMQNDADPDMTFKGAFKAGFSTTMNVGNKIAGAFGNWLARVKAEAAADAERARRDFYRSAPTEGGARRAFSSIGMSGKIYSDYRAYDDETFRRNISNLSDNSNRSDTTSVVVVNSSGATKASVPYGNREQLLRILTEQRKLEQYIAELYASIVESETIIDQISKENAPELKEAKKEALENEIKKKSKKIKDLEDSLNRHMKLMNGTTTFLNRFGDFGQIQESQFMTFDQMLSDNQEKKYAELASRELDSEVRNIRNTSDNDPTTVMALKSFVMSEMLTTYDTTRLKRTDTSKFTNSIRSKAWIPGGSKTIVDWFRMLIMSSDYRADFIKGFSLKDKVNVEIWYVTEPKSSTSKELISSFYVYDVTANKVVRANLPYYRNAIQIVLGKIGAV